MSSHQAHQQPANCAQCDAVCCRLTVVLMPEDRVPAHFTAITPEGLHVMAHNEEGWCSAIDPLHLRCTIYEQRPEACRRFAMNGPYCRAERAQYSQRMHAQIPLTLAD